MIEKENNRLLQFDLLKVFACFLVIWGHTIMHLYVPDYISNPIYRFIYSFHMSLFMMISGLFASSAMNLDIKSFLIKKSKQLIYPCFVWGGIVLFFVYGYKVLEQGLLHATISVFLRDLYWYSDFWFLKSCFICYCLAYFGVKTKLKTWQWMTITLLLSQLIPFFLVSFMYPSFLMGMLLKNSKALMNYVIKYKYMLFVLFVFMTLFWTKDVWIESHSMSVLLKESRFVDMLMLRLFRLVIGLMGALSFFAIWSSIEESKLTSNLVRRICDYGKYSLEIYIVHSVIFVEFICKHISLVELNYLQFNLLAAPSISLFVLVVCYRFITLLYRSKYISILLFGRCL